MMMMMMMMMTMMNCFCGMVDWQKVFCLISSRDHCQRSSPSWISNMPQAGFEPVQNLSSGLVEWSFAVVLAYSSFYSLFCFLPLFIHFIFWSPLLFSFQICYPFFSLFLLIFFVCFSLMLYYYSICSLSSSLHLFRSLYLILLCYLFCSSFCFLYTSSFC